jgi:hypothetical protein
MVFRRPGLDALARNITDGDGKALYAIRTQADASRFVTKLLNAGPLHLWRHFMRAGQ